jgi:hypothetical protein
LSDEQIAAECGTIRRQLARWKLTQQFQARVKEHRESYRSQVLDSRYCRKELRILARQQLIDKCLQIIKERSEWPGMEKIPGGKNGLGDPASPHPGRQDRDRVRDRYGNGADHTR